MVALTLCLVFAAGCKGGGGDDENRTGPQSKQEAEKSVQERMDAIKNNPNMSEAQKQQALGAFSANQGTTK